MSHTPVISSAARNLATFALLVLLAHTAAAEVIPPTPTRYFNDYASVVDAATADRLNSQLEQFEKDTSNQIVVAVFPKMESDSSIEDYTVRVARAWQAGQKANNNGAVLFVFIQDHKMYIQTGYGLEGALPDILCKQIIDNEIAPRFKQGDYAGGLTAGVNALMAAAKGEYKGTGHTVSEHIASVKEHWGGAISMICFLLLWCFLLYIGRNNRGTMYSSRGFGSGLLLGSMMGSGSGGGFSGGGGFGGGGFSGGGGGFGGGGAGGSW